MKDHLKEFTVNKFCCCISLRTGCFIIGWVTLFFWGSVLADTIDRLQKTGFDSPAKAAPHLYNLFGCFLIIYVSIMMLAGLHVGKKYFKEYMAIMILITLGLLGSISNQQFNTQDTDKNDSEQNETIFTLVVICIHFYFINVVYSYHVQLSSLDTPIIGLDGRVI